MIYNKEKQNRVLAILASNLLYGKERANINVYRLLLKYNFELKLICNKDANENLKREIEDINRIQILFPSYNQNNIVRYLYRLLFSFKILKYSILYKPNFIMLCDEHVAFSLAFMIRLLTPNIIYRAGDVLNLKMYGWKKEIYKCFWKHLISKNINTLVCNSKFVEDSFKTIRSSQKADKIIFNYPPSRKITNIYENKLYKKIGNLNFGFIGRIDQTKGCDHFVRAAINIIKKNSDIIFYVAGKLNSDQYSKSLIKMITKYENQIIHLGEIEDLKTFYTYIDVLIVPSLYEEPLANVITEAKLFHTPSIIYPSGGMPEIITHLVDGYICKEKSIRSLIEAIEFYIKSPLKSKMHGENAFNSIEEKGMSLACFEKKWLNIFQAN